jgi:biopolymer transport protein ExbD
MPRKTFLKHEKKPQDMALQITSMADIFTIILIFLLKSYSMGALDVSLPKGMQLPRAQTSSTKGETKILKVEVSESALTADGKAVTRMSAFSFPSSDLGQGQSRSLGSALGQAKDGKILVVADQRAPYETIRTVLATAASHGYTDVKLAVSRYE